MFAPIQADFAAALLDPDRPVPPAVTAHTSTQPTRRFAVYRNNVVTSLVDALRSRFPAVEKIVGEEFFVGMAHVFVARHPPRSPLLMTYGDEFPEFVAAFEPAGDLPYLADVARLEVARGRAYHAADAAPIDPARLQALTPGALTTLRVNLHPAMQIVRSAYPIVTIWGMNNGAIELAPIEDWRGEDALITRPNLEVEVRTLPPGGAALLQALEAGRTMGEAIELAVADNEAFDLVANFAGLIGSSLVVNLLTAEPA